MKNTKLQTAIKTVIAGAAITAFSANVMAAGAVTSSTRFFTGTSGNASLVSGGGTTAYVDDYGVIGIGGSLTGSTSTSKNSFTDNPLLSHSAWGHAGRWYSFQLTGDVDTTIRVDGLSTGWTPGMTVYNSSASNWDRGTSVPTEVGINTGTNTPHDFNGTGNIGDNGTNWMTGANGNMATTMAYANSGIVHHAGQTDWAEHIHGGVHAKAGTAANSDGVTGSTGAGFAELTFAGLDAGWYTVFIGGADSSSASAVGNFDVTVSTVPVPAAAWLMGTGLMGLLGMRRKKQA